MGRFFVGEYIDGPDMVDPIPAPKLMRRLERRLTLSQAEAITESRNRQIGHVVHDSGEFDRKAGEPRYYMFDLEEGGDYPFPGVGKNVRNSPEPPPEDFDDSVPSIEAGDWHDGPHEYEDGYDDDGQGIVCVKCAAAKREAKNER